MIKRNLMVVGLATLLSACGFQLRGTGDMAFALKEVNVTARDAYGPLVKDLRQTLINNDVNVHPGAPYTVALNRETRTRRTVSYTGSARSAEYQTTMEVTYELRGAKNTVLLTNTVDVQNTYVHDENNLIGSEQESLQLEDELRHELVTQLAQRLQLITPAQLEELQAAADAKAQAEADAIEAARKAEAETPQQSPLQLPIQTQ
ncbi:LPS-assembly lipoprotein LptE [Pseudomonas turukhanskensis]|uniref:LPS-assembly lipoprotein LptE n=1 Tax=Pseudomonas turukhanskensis TaxID=1806536 RepID=A0A9W6NI64_9PSED|nr:LPS assembly lipoprotein LptE [Pseudomonas turukhanskensis]GLK91843.1 LPS-assembly lipoprotein LptE [Pseudomonas turukhanskensis]